MKTVLALCMLIFVCCVILCPTFELNAEQKVITQPPQIRLVFKWLVEGQKITNHDFGIVKFEVVLERDRGPEGKPYLPEFKFDENKLKITINGKDTLFYFAGHGYGHNGKVNYLIRDVAIRPGPETGAKTIQATLDNLSAKVTVNFQPKGQIEFYRIFDGRALFGKEDESINWLGCYLKRDTIRLMINGKEVASEIKTSGYGKELLEGLSKGQLNRGANLIKIEAIDINGEKLEKQLTIFYYPDNEIPVGDTFTLHLAPMGSRSGPFYRVVVDGKGLVVLTKGIHQSEALRNDIITGLGKQGFVIERERPVITKFKAAQPGKSIIIIEKKRHFTEKVWLEDKRIQVTVIDK